MFDNPRQVTDKLSELMQGHASCSYSRGHKICLLDGKLVLLHKEKIQKDTVELGSFSLSELRGGLTSKGWTLISNDIFKELEKQDLTRKIAT